MTASFNHRLCCLSKRLSGIEEILEDELSWDGGVSSPGTRRCSINALICSLSRRLDAVEQFLSAAGFIPPSRAYPGIHRSLNQILASLSRRMDAIDEYLNSGDTPIPGTLFVRRPNSIIVRRPDGTPILRAIL